MSVLHEPQPRIASVWMCSPCASELIHLREITALVSFAFCFTFSGVYFSHPLEIVVSNMLKMKPFKQLMDIVHFYNGVCSNFSIPAAEVNLSARRMTAPIGRRPISLRPQRRSLACDLSSVAGPVVTLAQPLSQPRYQHLFWIIKHRIIRLIYGSLYALL